jgi:hypothetical protein
VAPAGEIAIDGLDCRTVKAEGPQDLMSGLAGCAPASYSSAWARSRASWERSCNWTATRIASQAITVLSRFTISENGRTMRCWPLALLRLIGIPSRHVSP